VAQQQNIFAGCSKRPFSKAAASEEARRYKPHSCGPFALAANLGERKDPSSASDLRESLSYVEPLSDARTPLGERCVLAHRGWAGDNRDFFSILLGAGRRRQSHFDARVIFIDVFVEVGFDDAVVIDAESLAEGILRDLEPAIDVSS
jgi:hypothetical protein